MGGFIIIACVLAVPVLFIGWLIALYNRLVILSKRRDEAWSGILVQLKRRHDLVPNLVNTVKGYAQHERGLLEEVTKARAPDGGARQRDVEQSEQAFSQSLIRLFAVAENYPEIKADRNFQELQSTLVGVEDDIQMARRYFNGTVRDYNTCVATFPGLLVARRYGFKESRPFQLERAADAEVPVVSFGDNA